MFNHLFNRVPKWVKDLPDSAANKALLLRIIAASDEPLASPKKVIFAIKQLRDEEDAKSVIQEYLDDEGWVCRIDHDPETGVYLVEGQKDKYVISEDQLSYDEGLFSRVARLYNAEYDGWTVVLPPRR